jgi:hypothetical protein
MILGFYIIFDSNLLVCKHVVEYTKLNNYFLGYGERCAILIAQKSDWDAVDCDIILIYKVSRNNAG